MSSIVRHVDKKTGNVYLFESRSFRDSITKKVKTEKVYLGRENPITGELIPKAPPGKRNRGPSAKQIELASEEASEKIQFLSRKVQELENTISDMRKKLDSANRFADVVAKAAANYREETSNEG